MRDLTRKYFEGAYRADSGRVRAALIRRFDDFDLAEDLLQDAVAAALDRWPAGGLPRTPGAWLYVVARNRGIDRLRSAHARRTRSFETMSDLPGENGAHIEMPGGPERHSSEETIPEERLRLIFSCCHPALAHDGAVALTLYTLGGLSTREIARAFLVSEETMTRRLTRVKHKIRVARIPFELPDEDALPARVAAALDVLYLIYNQGYTVAGTDGVDLCGEALRLARLMYELYPETECAGLLALLLFHEAREPARRDAGGARISLEEQDRALWNRTYIAEGQALLADCLAAGRPGLFQIQAAISAVHSESLSFADTDWKQICALYRTLASLDPSPVVELNFAVALSFAYDPQTALRHIAALRCSLRDYQPFHAARADLLRRTFAASSSSLSSGNAGRRRSQAIRAYRRAMRMTVDAADRPLLSQRIAELTAKL